MAQRFQITKPTGMHTLFMPDNAESLTGRLPHDGEAWHPNNVVSVISRPWGMWEEFSKNLQCTIRILTCQPGQSLSDQRHALRDELFIVLDCETLVELEGEVLNPAPGDYVLIPRHTWHRLSCGGQTAVRVVEIAFGEYDQENDIVRRHDYYGRPLSGAGIGAV